MSQFDEHWNRDVGAIFADAYALGDDVLMDISAADDVGSPLLAPGNEIVRSEEIRQDLRRAGLQEPTVIGQADTKDSKVNTTMLFVLLGIGVIGAFLLLSNTGRPQLTSGRRF
jgi:hypothetical protein